MKSENEFIAGVYEKYERELEKRRKRTRFISTCTALSACACAVIAVSIRTLPTLLNDPIVADDIAVYGYDNAYNDGNDTENELAAMPLDEAQGMMTRSAVDAEKDDSENGDAKCASGGYSDIAGDAENGIMLYSMQRETYSLRDDEAVKDALSRRVKGLNGSFEYMLPATSDGLGLRELINTQEEYYVEDEYYADTGVVCGECVSEGAYLVSLEENGEILVLLLDDSVYTLEDAMLIADTLCYTAEREE